jgi:cell division protease FtsH
LNKTPRLRFRIAALVVVAAAAALLAHAVFAPPSAKVLDESELRTAIANGNVTSATILARSHAVAGRLVDGTRFRVDYAESSTAIAQELLRAHVKVKTDQQRANPWVGVLTGVLPFVVLFGIVFYFMRLVSGGGRFGGMGRSKAKLFTKDRPTVKFADVAGVDEAVEELHEIKEFLAEPVKFQQLGARIPKGVLLVGPPGTGKTLLARAVAGEACVPFFSISGSDFVEMFVGVGASRVRDLFAQANAAAPAIVFVDEIDAVGRHRGSGLGGGHDEREQTLNQLLVEMDGFDVSKGVILIAATNRPDILDPALLRPGRFDRQIVVDRPDVAGRRAILAVHARGKPFAPGVDLDIVARRTPGFTGADLANLLNEAALLAARHGFAQIGVSQLDEAVERVMAGLERRTRIISEAEKQVIAYHEAGHALVAHALPHTDPVHKVSIIPRGRALGYTLTLPLEDRFLVRRSELVDELAMLLGGRAAEEMIFGDPTTGAQNDIERSTVVARQMVTEFGMSDRLGPVHFTPASGNPFLGGDSGNHFEHSDELAAVIDEEVQKLIDTAHREARTILETNRGVLEKLANALIEFETLDAADAQAILVDARAYEREIVLPGSSSRPAAVAASDVGHNTGRTTT